jgi:quinol monooxygenase YgiN
MAYVVVAELTVPADRLEAFIAQSLDDARDSVAHEPGCRQFEVHVPVDGAPTVVLYEVYDDRAAFEAHLTTPHFERWRDAAQDWITDRRVQFLTRRS